MQSLCHLGLIYFRYRGPDNKGAIHMPYRNAPASPSWTSMHKFTSTNWYKPAQTCLTDVAPGEIFKRKRHAMSTAKQL